MGKTLTNVLFLVPVPISDMGIKGVIPLEVLEHILEIQCFIVENAKTARQFLKQVNPEINWNSINMIELDKHKPESTDTEIRNLFVTADKIGLMSEAGLPCIADPGNRVVKLAHEAGWRVKPLSGPSSILLALISSGMNGQNFRFNGYLPSKQDERIKRITMFEKQCRESTQLFIETPYRNDRLMEDLMRYLNPETRLLVASDLTGENEEIICCKISEWKKRKPVLGKVPCIFGLGYWP